MKKIVCFTIYLMINICFVFSQTNVFPSSGNVGIGTISPVNLLEIASGSGGTILTLKRNNANISGSFGHIGFKNSDNFFVASIGVIGDGGNTGSHLVFKTMTASDKTDCFSVTERMRITNNGKIGIGTSAPDAMLTINPGAVSTTNLSGTNFNLGSLLKSTSGRSGYVAVVDNNWLNNAGSNGHFISLFPYDNVSGTNDDLQWKAFRLMSGSSLQDKFWVNKNGDGYYAGSLAIGTITIPSGYKLAVDGKIRAREIKIDTDTWSDFVFSPNYKLRSLEETEQFINENGHLPEIPSAGQVKEEGISLGEMNAKLLQKIEELTLYNIEMNRKIEMLIEKNKNLENEMEQLKTNN